MMSYTLYEDTDPPGLRVVAPDGSVVAYAAPQHGGPPPKGAFGTVPWIAVLHGHTPEGRRLVAAQGSATITFLHGPSVRGYMERIKGRCEEMQRISSLVDAWNTHTGHYASSSLDDTRTSFYTRARRVATWDFSPLIRLQLQDGDRECGTLDDLECHLARWTGGAP